MRGDILELIMLSDEFGVFMETKDGLKKLEGFSRLNFNSGAESYIRKYFSTQGESIDITGAKPVISYQFDRMKNNAVHDFLADISVSGLKGSDAYTNLVFVDLPEEADGRYKAFKQGYVVLCADTRPENGFLDYSGKLVARGSGKKGSFILNDDFKSGEFIPERSGILCE